MSSLVKGSPQFSPRYTLRGRGHGAPPRPAPRDRRRVLTDACLDGRAPTVTTLVAFKPSELFGHFQMNGFLA